MSNLEEYTFNKCKVLLKITLGYMKSLLQFFLQWDIPIVIEVACGAILSLKKRCWAPLKLMVVLQEDEVFLKVFATCGPSVSNKFISRSCNDGFNGHGSKDK